MAEIVPRTSPAIRVSLATVNVPFAVPSYTLLVPVKLMLNDRCVMLPTRVG